MGDKKGEKPEEMSEDDKRLQEDLNLLVERLTDPDESLYKPALESLRDMIRTSTTSMTSVPRPLKYLRCHYETLKDVYLNIEDKETQMYCADVISVLAMAAHGEKGDDERESLKYCLLGTIKDVGDWGHEYVRHLEGEIVIEWSVMSSEKEDETKKQLLPLVENIVQFDMHHNAEIHSCDLLLELDQLQLLKEHMDADNYLRVCLYLVSCAAYMEERNRLNTLQEVFDYYMKFEEYPRALCVGMHLRNHNMMTQIFRDCKNLDMRKQLAYMIGMMQTNLEFDDQAEDSDDLNQIMSNSHISDHFNHLAKELDITEPKAPEDIYKTWLEGTLVNAFNPNIPVESAKHNLASSFVNAFVNAGFGRDKLVTDKEGTNWIYRNRECGMMSATASLGLIYLWDDAGLSAINSYLYSDQDYIKSGALLALGIVNCGVKNEFDAAKALLQEHVLDNSNILRSGAILGLGLAYAGSYREDILNLLLPAMIDTNSTPEVIALAAIACSLVAVGTCDHQVCTTVVQVLKDTTDLSNTFFRFLPVALGICHLGKKDDVDPILLEALDEIPDPLKSMAQALLRICAYAGTGDVLVIQEMLHICSECSETEKDDEVKERATSAGAASNPGSEETTTPATEVRENRSEVKDQSDLHAVATLGVAIVALGGEVGTDMSPRIYGQLGRYGDPAVRKAMPLGIALCSLSNPQIPAIEILNKYSHDSDLEVAHNAIFSMGLVGAGSNNARLATMLRQLAQFHAKNPNHLFMVRLAQGLNHMGKGTMSLSPFRFDRQIMSNVAVAGLLITLFSFLDVKNTILGKSHYLLYTLVAAMHPRWLVTLDENLQPLSVSVRVGQAVDIVGKAGTPKTITGIITHNTPVLLGVGERAELATEEYTPLTPVLEGFVMLHKNPQL